MGLALFPGALSDPDPPRPPYHRHVLRDIGLLGFKEGISGLLSLADVLSLSLCRGSRRKGERFIDVK